VRRSLILMVYVYLKPKLGANDSPYPSFTSDFPSRQVWTFRVIPACRLIHLR